MHKRNNKLLLAAFYKREQKKIPSPQLKTGRKAHAHHSNCPWRASFPLPHLTSPSTPTKLTRPLHNCCYRATILRRSLLQAPAALPPWPRAPTRTAWTPTLPAASPSPSSATRRSHACSSSASSPGPSEYRARRRRRRSTTLPVPRFPGLVSLSP